jgi:hypothetical protein
MLFHKTLNKSVISRALDRGIPSVQSKGLKDPFELPPKRDLKFLGWSWRRGLFPPPFIVMSSEARHLLFNRKGQKSHFRTYPIKDLKPFGGVLRGILSHPQLNWRPLAKCVRGDNQSKGLKDPPSNFPQKRLKNFLGGVGGWRNPLLHYFSILLL